MREGSNGVNLIIKKSFKVTLVLVLATVAVLIFMRQERWAGGFAVGALWSSVNFLFTIRILDVAVLRQPKPKLLLFLLVKFPLLYILGLFILISGFFPVWSILAGLFPVLVITGVSGLWRKQA